MSAVGLFRPEALAHHGQREREGDILRIDDRWTRIAYNVAIAAALTALVFTAVVPVSEYASGRGRALRRTKGARRVRPGNRRGSSRRTERDGNILRIDDCWTRVAIDGRGKLAAAVPGVVEEVTVEPGHSRIVIAHRLASVVAADRILVMQCDRS